MDGGLKFYTYTPKNLKPKSLILKGVVGGYDEVSVKADIDPVALSQVKIIKVTKILFNSMSQNAALS